MMVGLTKEKIIISGMVALFEAIGLYGVLLMLCGMVPAQCDPTVSISVISILSAFIWGYLLCRNC
ncbi:MAG: hypothetical protein K6G05_08915 [Lachnospiraceae bacterium]|jgi:ABC-type molybdate transport system permease subunit|nr:hypothetical protein [Lachnospiraceae bacterium]